MTQFITLSKQAKDLTGQRFGRWLALGPVGRNRNKKVLWLCRCECGAEKAVDTQSLLKGDSRSCGCWKREVSGSGNRTHGLSSSPIYAAWCTMVARCRNPQNGSYFYYGNRGIDVCEDWANSFDAYYAYVSNLPHFGETGRTLDRIDNDGDYAPENVRWATQHEQSRNRRCNIFLTHNGKTQTVAEWANELGISRTKITNGIKQGRAVADILTPAHAPTTLEHDGQCLTIKEWSHRLKISEGTIRDRLKRGNAIADVLSQKDHRSKRTYPKPPRPSRARHNSYTGNPGEKHPSAKLGEVDVKKIRMLWDQGVPQSEIARRYDVSQSTIWRIVHKKGWGHIP